MKFFHVFGHAGRSQGAVNARLITVIGVIAVIGFAGIWAYTLTAQNKPFVLTPKEKQSEVSQQADVEVGTGWSVNENADTAIREAVAMALKGKANTAPEFAILFATSGSDLPVILTGARKLLGENVKLYGGTSSARAVMTDKGFVNVKDAGPYTAMSGKRGVVIMTVSSKDITFGVGSAKFVKDTVVGQAAKSAILDAIKSAGKNPGDKPNIVLVTPSRLVEEEVLEGIDSVVGADTVVLGGTSGGPPRGSFAKNEVYEEGVSVAVMYTDLPVGWTFEGGFDVTDLHSGIVTKSIDQEIIEIDGKPALDVYNEWLGGQITTLHETIKEPRAIRDLLTLHPLYRKFKTASGQTYNLFSHPWPKDDNLVERTVMTSTKIKVGERVYLSNGSWETLLNRIGNLPKLAKVSAEMPVSSQPLFGIGYICNGVLGSIPETEREKMYKLVMYANGNAPFISPFTSGEQGHFVGIGNKHGNLLTSFIVVGSKKK